MQTIHKYLIVPDGDRYNNVKKIGDKELIVNSVISERDFKFVNRIGIVTAIPKAKGILEIGDKVIVHHNVFRKWWNVQKKLKNSGSWVNKDQFACYKDQIFAYKRGDEEWTSLEDYCFVKPIEKGDGLLYDIDRYQTQLGTVKISNPILKSQGVGEGDTIGFSPYSEYKFEIDGEILYKMSALKDATYVIN